MTERATGGPPFAVAMAHRRLIVSVLDSRETVRRLRSDADSARCPAPLDDLPGRHGLVAPARFSRGV